MASQKFLDIPAAAQRDKASFEVMRVFIAEQGQHVSIQSGAWEDPFAWGIVLADLARHIAHAHQMQNSKVDPEAFMERLLEGFQAEIDNPTDEPEGEITQ
jgi:ureidoglycolate hydrolase